MTTIEKLKKYREHLEAHQAYLAKGINDPLSNHAHEREPHNFELITPHEVAMAKAVHDNVMNKYGTQKS